MNLIKQYRENKGLTQDQLALAVNVTQSAVAKWEVGDVSPRANMLMKLSKLFGCSIDELLRIEDKESQRSGDVA